jgi:peptidoglycan/LPS O-acetylase OafA/YrhL
VRAELVLMGRRVDMSRRARRRALVVGIYAVFAAPIIGLWFVDQWHSTGTYIYRAAMLACWLFLGGYYSSGLVKPSTGKGPRRSYSTPSLLLLKLRMYPAMAADDDRPYQNDERELHQRDRAHYQAYQAIALVVVTLWIVAYVGMEKPHWMAAIQMTPFQMFYGLTLVTMMLIFTLPQCILLWTEPDMEAEG